MPFVLGHSILLEDSKAGEVFKASVTYEGIPLKVEEDVAW